MKFKQLKNLELELLDKIVKLEEKSFGGKGSVDLWMLKALIRYGRTFVVEKKGKILGIIEFMQCFEKKEVFLYGICVDEECRRRGIGSWMLKSSENYLKEHGYGKILLTVDPENHIAIKLYKNNGYEILEYKENEYGNGVHRYLMGKSI